MISVENVEIVSHYKVSGELLHVDNSNTLCVGLKEKIEETLDIDGPCVVVIKSDNKYALFNQEGILLTEEWFDYFDHFHCGFTSVKLNGKYNYINIEGKYLSEQWFDYVYKFSEDFGRVSLNGKWNFINKEGELLSDQWFDDVLSFEDGVGVVQLNERWNLIDKGGRFVYDDWFDDNDDRYINNIHERLVTDYSYYEYDYDNVFEEDGFFYC